MTNFILILSIAFSLFFNSVENRVLAASVDYSTVFRLVSQDSTKKRSEVPSPKSLKNKSASRALLYSTLAYGFFYFSIGTLASSSMGANALFLLLLGGTLSLFAVLFFLSAGLFHFFKALRLFRRNKELTGRGNLVLAGILLFPAVTTAVVLLYLLGIEVFQSIR
jgi:hypothetical protein